MIEHRDIPVDQAWDIVTERWASAETMRRVADHVAATERFIGTFADGVPLGVFGGARATILSSEGYCWFQAADALQQHRIAFARASPRIVDMMFETFDPLVGVSYEPSSVRWLQWMGAKFGERTGEGWRPFVFRRDNG